MTRLAVVVAAIGLVLSATAVPAAASSGPRIRPHQLFIGFVNQERPTATINMACFGAIRPGQTGHPMAGQTLSVQRSLDIPGGNTGRASKVVVTFTLPPGVADPQITFTNYGTQTLPTAFVFPCAGQGTAVFQPVPLSGGGRADTVTVDFVGQP